MERWTPLAEARERLETELGHEPFAAAWRRGEVAELEAVADALLADAPQLAEPAAGGAT